MSPGCLLIPRAPEWLEPGVPQGTGTLSSRGPPVRLRRSPRSERSEIPSEDRNRLREPQPLPEPPRRAQQLNPAAPKHRWAAAGPASITCRARGSRAGHPWRGRAVPAPALPSLRSLPSLPFLSLPFLSLRAPRGSRTLRPWPAAAESAARGCTGKVCLKLCSASSLLSWFAVYEAKRLFRSPCLGNFL